MGHESGKELNCSQVNQPISKIVWENCEITDPKALANTFNNYFANIGGNLASSIPSATKTASEFVPYM